MRKFVTSYDYFFQSISNFIFIFLPLTKGIKKTSSFTIKLYKFLSKFYLVSVWFQLKPTFTFSFPRFCPFFFFFSAWTVNLLCKDKNYCLCTVTVLFTYCSSTVHALKILKMGHTVLFTHLKIILLNNKLNPNGPYM